MLKLLKLAAVSTLAAVLYAPPAAAVAPAPPFESYLTRAATVFVGRFVSRDGASVSFEVAEPLRGDPDGKGAGSVTYAIDAEGLTTHANAQSWLVLSQGDDKYGPPLPRVSLGTQLDGQCCYRGWLAFPLVEEGGERYVGRAHTATMQKPGERPTRVTLEMARVLSRKFAYRGDIHGDGFIKVEGRVVDGQGAPVEGATVALEANGVIYTEERSRADGSYSIGASFARRKFTVWLVVTKGGHEPYRKGFDTNSRHDQEVILRDSP